MTKTTEKVGLKQFIQETGEAIYAAIESYKAELLKEVGEPIAVTNQAQLGYVTDGMHPDIPLAMWAKETSYSGANIALYTSDQVAAAILKATKPLEDEISRLKDKDDACDDAWFKIDELRAQLASAQEEIKTVTEQKNQMWFEMQTAQNQLAKAEQRVAEACTLLCMDAVTKSKSSLFRSGAIIVAGEIRDGEWRKFVKEV